MEDGIARGASLQILGSKLGEVKQVIRGLETGVLGQGGQIVRVKPRQMGRQTRREGVEADREAGTLWDSEWVACPPTPCRECRAV